jgi:hypothetical protein
MIKKLFLLVQDKGRRWSGGSHLLTTEALPLSYEAGFDIMMIYGFTVDRLRGAGATLPVLAHSCTCTHTTVGAVLLCLKAGVLVLELVSAIGPAIRQLQTAEMHTCRVATGTGRVLRCTRLSGAAPRRAHCDETATPSKKLTCWLHVGSIYAKSRYLDNTEAWCSGTLYAHMPPARTQPPNRNLSTGHRLIVTHLSGARRLCTAITTETIQGCLSVGACRCQCGGREVSAVDARPKRPMLGRSPPSAANPVQSTPQKYLPGCCSTLGHSRVQC